MVCGEGIALLLDFIWDSADYMIRLSILDSSDVQG